ncbi:MAG TPA: prepilin-type N-terminal cleavage/methylation domain-containing protein [Candidatus Paceibacterota bacterium]|nr:prepilin-type N-terminal cleavage/methylation domain-containing protein [Candidatus Paceibacterota bacterium]
MRRGLTLIEIVITIAIIAILVGTYFLVANPAGQLASARNSRRTTDLETIMLAIKSNIADQGNGKFSCASGAIPTSTKNMGSAAGSYNIAPCIVPTYISVMPSDPGATSSYYNSPSDYNTGYSISINASNTITLSAPHAELGKTVTLSQ